VKDHVVFEVICKECGWDAIAEWIPPMEITDVKDRCPRCWGTDWADRMTREGKKIMKMAHGVCT
jgi:hypothetical protein